MNSKDISGTLVFRLFILAFLIILLNSWTAVHFGTELKQFIIVNILVAVVGLIGVFNKLLEKEEGELIRNKLRRWLFYILQTPTLITLWAIFLIAGFFISSVTVFSSSNYTLPKAFNTTESNNIIKGYPAVIQVTGIGTPITVLVNPFGRSLMLKIKGYQRFYFDLHPWIPRKIHLEEDLTISPTVLIRVADSRIRFINICRIDLFL